MLEALERVRPALARMLDRTAQAEATSLASLARSVRLSSFHFHRMFSRALGETSKQYGLRVRLARAAAALLRSRATILEIALEHGFANHETFTRAFRKRFGTSPRAYRRRGLLGVSPDAAPALADRNDAVVAEVAPCVGLYRAPASSSPSHPTSTVVPAEESPMSQNREITTQLVPEQHVLLMRRKINLAEIASALAEILPRVFAYAQEIGAPMAGPPFTRYLQMGPGFCTLEAGVPLASECPGRDDIVPGELGGQRVATTVHVGPYDRLSETYRELEQWMEEHGVQSAGAPWEQYLTDPAEVPDAEQWQTAVFWPITDG
ncbi:AraC family transcriptional regulator [Paraliomyxa miuraensis]|uniref:AraC family transcriptional regulator n=1 Tax=Paraliomyxa miuraensis TaxID=376150 RepID=UPI00225BE187|nr:AraC family transcriptional regulator [Paraliomyxa miuraensis]MCX4239729.1 AraC family transcriptional regulator [Paraliomyxa miuraensis]